MPREAAVAAGAAEAVVTERPQVGVVAGAVMAVRQVGAGTRASHRGVVVTMATRQPPGAATTDVLPAATMRARRVATRGARRGAGTTGDPITAIRAAIPVTAIGVAGAVGAGALAWG